MKFFKLLILILFAATALFALRGQTLAFDLFGQTCTGAAASSTPCLEKTKNGTENKFSGPNGILKNAADIIAVVTGIAAVIVIVASGLSFVTSGGNEEKTKKARQNIIYALAGLAVVLLAWTLITFAIDHILK